MTHQTSDISSKDGWTEQKDGEHELLERDSENSQAEQSTAPARDVHGFKWVLVVTSLISATFLWGLDGTITADIQATFVRDFHSIEKLAYNSVGFFLGAAAVVLSWYAWCRTFASFCKISNTHR